MVIITIILHLLMLAVEVMSKIYDLKQKHKLCFFAERSGIIAESLNATYHMRTRVFLNIFLPINIQTAVKWSVARKIESRSEATFIQAEQIEYYYTQTFPAEATQSKLRNTLGYNLLQKCFLNF